MLLLLFSNKIKQLPQLLILSIMNITTIYKEMENRVSLNLDIYFNYLQEHVNSPSFSLKEVLETDKKYLRAFACAAFNIERPEIFLKLITTDSNMKVFTSHMALIKCSAELLNLNHSHEKLENLLNNVIEGVRQAKINSPGTTLSFAFGFVLGTAIKRGINVKSFFHKLDSTFITDNDKLFTGLCSGLHKDSSLLVSNESYITNLWGRYDTWDNRSKVLSLSMFKGIEIDKLNQVAVNENNLKVLEYFSKRNNSYDQFLNHYTQQIDNLNLQRETETPKQVMSQDILPQHSTSDTNESVSFQTIIDKQAKEIKAIEHELSLYKSVFKQFETLFPDLEQTLQNLDKNPDLLNKIQDLVSKQKNNIHKLEDYFEESEKQKAIKDSIKKRL